MTNFIPPLTWFRAFECAARRLSFTKAAEDLNLTQSAISQHVRALEENLGCALFVRKHRGLILTDQGRRLLPQVSNAITTLASAADTFRTTTQNNVITVAASPSIARWYIVPHLKSFTDMHPDIAVRLTTGTWPDEFSHMDSDVEIRFDSAQSSDQTAKLLMPNEMQIVASPTLLSTETTSTSVMDTIKNHPLIQVIGTLDTWQDWASRKGFEGDLKAIALVESHGIAVEMARSGLGIAYTNGIVAAPSVADKSLHIIERSPNMPKEGYYMKTKTYGDDPIVETFAAWLRSLISKAQPQ